MALVNSYLRVPKPAGQIKKLIFLVKNVVSPICQYFCDAGQVAILLYLEVCIVL